MPEATQSNSDKGAAKTFFRKHDHAMTIIGALIVFLTFVLKEGVQDRVSALVRSLETAETAFLIREGSNESSAELDKATTRIEQLWSDTIADKQDGRPTNSTRSEELWTLGHAQHAYMVQALNNASRLYYKLPEKPAGLVSELDFVERTTAKVVYDESDQIVILRNRLSWDRKTGAPTESTSEELASLTSRYAVRAADGVQRLFGFGENVLIFSERARRDAEERLRIWTLASYVLYVVGWGLGLAGKLYGAGSLVS